MGSQDRLTIKIEFKFNGLIDNHQTNYIIIIHIIQLIFNIWHGT